MAGEYPANRATGNGGCGGCGGATGGAIAGATGGGIMPDGIPTEAAGVMGVTWPVGGIAGPNSDSFSGTEAVIFKDPMR